MFKAMADRTRQKVMRLLAEQELSVSELVEVLGQPQSTVSRHLKVLREAGLVEDRRAGATVMYAPAPGAGIAKGDEVRDLSTRWSRRPRSGHTRPVAEVPPGNGRGARSIERIREWMLSWISSEEMESETRKRLARVLKSRGDRNSFYERVGHRWDQLRLEAYGFTFHLEAMVGLLPSRWTVADIGTGTGYSLGVLASHFAKVIAVDRDPAMLDLVKQRSELRSARNIVCREGSLEKLPLEAGEVDLMIVSLVLHHAERPADVFAEMRRALVPQGRLLLIEQRRHASRAFQERMDDIWRGFSPDQVKEWATAAGFADIEVRPLNTGVGTGRRMEDAPGIYALTALARPPDRN
jgi:DNA-binding transcriptional ArsR family regulator